MMTIIAREKGPEAIPASTEAPPKRESRPPAAATIAIIATPTGLLGFGAEDCIKSRLLVGMISLLDKLVARRLRITAWSQRAAVFAGATVCGLDFPEASRELWHQISRAWMCVDGGYWVIIGRVKS